MNVGVYFMRGYMAFFNKRFETVLHFNVLLNCIYYEGMYAL